MRKYTSKEIRNKAREIIGDNKNLTAQKVLDKLRKKYDYEYILFDADKDTSHVKGAVISDSDGKNIFINKILPDSEQLFVYAHEVSHILLHSGKDHMGFIAKPKVHNQDKSDEETEANMLAYELLFPLANFIDSYDKNDGNVLMISQEFYSDTYRTMERIRFLHRNKLLCLDNSI